MALQCEVCGRPIAGRPYEAIIEGAQLVVCGGCATLGSKKWKIRTSKQVKSTMGTPRSKKQRKFSSSAQSFLGPLLELVDDYGTRIRQARDAQELTHEDLGRRINEKVSVLKKLENHKMRPDNKLAEKLQHALRIKLLVPPRKDETPKRIFSTTLPAKAITLGDLIEKKKKPSEEKELKEPS